jgi:hypothetical protein
MMSDIFLGSQSDVSSLKGLFRIRDLPCYQYFVPTGLLCIQMSSGDFVMGL